MNGRLTNTHTHGFEEARRGVEFLQEMSEEEEEKEWR